MRKLVSLLAFAAFVGGAAALALAQTSAAPASAEKKMDEAKSEGKMPTKSASGRVKSMSGDSLVVLGKSRGEPAEWTFALDSKTRIRKGGREATAADLKEGDPVSVRYMERDGKNVAQIVMARGASKKAGQ